MFLKTEATQNLSQHNPDRDTKLSVPEQQHTHIKFGETNFAQKFRFGASKIHTLQNCPSWQQPISFQFSSSSEDDDEADYQPYRQRAPVYGEITPKVNICTIALATANQFFHSPKRQKMKLMKQSINITDNGLRFFHNGLL